MTERSYVWEGIITGDSTLAPYYAEAFNRYMHLHLDGGTDDIYVLPGHLDDLEPLYSLGSPYSLSVKPGTALFKNFIYAQTTSESLAFDTVTAGYYRVDTVVLQINYGTQKIRPIVKKGSSQTTIATALTTPATLTQTAGYVWEEVLFHVLLDGNEVYNCVADRRNFVINFDTQLRKTSLVNAEFLAFTVVLATQGPEGWTNSDATALSTTTPDPIQARGQRILLTANQGIRQTVYTVPDTNKVFSCACLSTQGTSPTLRMRGILPTGGYTDWVTTFGYTAFGDTITLTHRFSEEINAIEVEIINLLGIGTCYIGQVILVEGYYPGNNQLLIDQTIPFQDNVDDAAWSATAKSTGNTTINLTASFNADIKAGTKAVVLRLEANDSGSAGAAGLFLRGSSLKTEGDTILDNIPNDYDRSQTMLVPVSYEVFNTSSGVPQFILGVQASGVGTLDATAQIVGIIT